MRIEDITDWAMGRTVVFQTPALPVAPCAYCSKERRCLKFVRRLTINRDAWGIGAGGLAYALGRQTPKFAPLTNSLKGRAGRSACSRLGAGVMDGVFIISTNLPLRRLFWALCA